MLAAFVSLLVLTLPNDSELKYRVSFENAAHHEASIEIEVDDIESESVEFVMSQTSPGRYALHQFAKNVYRVRASDREGNELTIDHPTPNQWVVSGHDGYVRFQYDLFGDLVDGTYTAFDRDHAHMNIPATFMWIRGLEERPITLEIQPIHDDWKVATQLEPTDHPFTFRAPNTYYFLDSPIEVSDHDVREWAVNDQNGEQYVRIALHHEGTEEEFDVFARMAERVVREQFVVFGEYPRYDYGRYTFIADYLSYVSGDGMEHRNSTILTSTRPLSVYDTSNLGTLSHEFFHGWNVERLRPRSLEPFDFERANPSRELWFAEGFTNYYDDLMIHRAGLSTLDAYAGGLSYRINAVTNSPGRMMRSAPDMSELAIFVDAARSVDPQNTDNTFISYYTYGDAIALGLDLTLRVEQDKTLDEYMARVWAAYGRDEIPYSNAELLDVLTDYTDETFATEYFRRFIFGREVAPYASLLEHAGIVVDYQYPGVAYAGNARLGARSGVVTILQRTSIGSPFYNAGLDIGCQIVSANGMEISSANDWYGLVDQHSPGDSINLVYKFRDETHEAELVLQQHPQLRVSTFEQEGREVTDEILQFRASWLDGKADQTGAELYCECPTCGRRYDLGQQRCVDDNERLKFAK